MYMLFVFGREVERFIGRRAFIALYLLLLFVPTLLLTVWGFAERTAIGGSWALHFAVFVAFATIYPSLEMFLRIMAKWVALALGAIDAAALSRPHAWPGFVAFGPAFGVAFFSFVRAASDRSWSGGRR